MESKSINLILFGRFPTERAYGVHAVAVADGYRRLGYKTTIFYPSTSNEKTIYEDPKEYYGNENVNYQKIEHLDITKYFWYKILPKTIQGFLWSVTAFLWAKKIKKYIDDPYSIIWSTNPILLYGALQDKNYVIFEMHGRARKIQALALKLVDKKASSRSIFISSSEYGKEDLLKRKLATKIEYLHNSVDLDIFKPSMKNPYVYPEEQPFLERIRDLDPSQRAHKTNCLHIGYVGQLETYGIDKGLFLTIDALQRALNENPHSFKSCGPIKLTIIGGPKESVEKLNRHLEEKNYEGSILLDYLGQKKQSELASLISGFDVGIVPYPKDEHISLYSSPMKIFEYAACGIPIIASDIKVHKSLEYLNLGIRCYEAENIESLGSLLSNFLHQQNRDGEEGLRSLSEMNISVRNGLSWEVRSKKTLDNLFN